MVMVVLNIKMADHIKGSSSTHLYTAKRKAILVSKYIGKSISKLQVDIELKQTSVLI
jgi:hypothetical protein